METVDVQALMKEVSELRVKSAELEAKLDEIESAAYEEAVLGEHNLIPSYRAEIAQLEAKLENTLEALKLAHDVISNFPRSLGYDITHLPKIEKAISLADYKEQSNEP